MHYRAKRENPYNDVEQMRGALVEIKESISPVPFPYVNGQISTLGGMQRPTILLRVSLQPKEEWTNGIFENSVYAHVSISNDGTMEMFSGCMKPKLRKSHVISVHDAINKLSVWGERARGIKPF